MLRIALDADAAGDRNVRAGRPLPAPADHMEHGGLPVLASQNVGSAACAVVIFLNIFLNYF